MSPRVPGSFASRPPALVRRRDAAATAVEARLVGMGALIAACYDLGKCAVTVGREPVGHSIIAGSEYRWHLVVSHPGRYPTWDEVKFARYELVPDEVVVAMLLPPADDYLDLHKFALHLWEVHDEGEPWRA